MEAEPERAAELFREGLEKTIDLLPVANHQHHDQDVALPDFIGDSVVSAPGGYECIQGPLDGILSGAIDPEKEAEERRQEKEKTLQEKSQGA